MINNPQIDFAAFGIVIDDIVLPEGQTHMGILGGGGPQTAWGMAAALGEGARVGVVAYVGVDFDDTWLAPLRAAGVNLDGVQRVWEKTPRAWQLMEHDGRRTHVWRSPPRGRSALPDAYAQARALHWGLHPENPDLVGAQTLMAQGKWVSLETFKPPDEPLSDTALRELVTSCVVFSPNWGEAARITGTEDYAGVLRRFEAAGCHILALRRGEQGADIWDLREGMGVRVPAVPTAVVDTVGAGNAFCGALLVGLEPANAQRTQKELMSAGAHGAAAASYMVGQIGIPRTLPDADEYARRRAYALQRAQEISHLFVMAL
jgi:sugar/nucleoside kinase (ribokinase family)